MRAQRSRLARSLSCLKALRNHSSGSAQSRTPMALFACGSKPSWTGLPRSSNTKIACKGSQHLRSWQASCCSRRRIRGWLLAPSWPCGRWSCSGAFQSQSNLLSSVGSFRQFGILTALERATDSVDLDHSTKMKSYCRNSWTDSYSRWASCIRAALSESKQPPAFWIYQYFARSAIF